MDNMYIVPEQACRTRGSCQLNFLTLILQSVGADPAIAKSLGLTREDVQQAGSASKLTLQLQKTLELDEYPAHECTSRTVASYRLVVVVFRTGGFTSGHYYSAVQASPDSWVVLNSEQTFGPYSLDEIQALHGDHIYGTAYLRHDMPVVGDRQSLGQWLQQPQNAEAARYLQLSHMRQTLVAVIAYCPHLPAGACCLLLQCN